MLMLFVVVILFIFCFGGIYFNLGCLFVFFLFDDILFLVVCSNRFEMYFCFVYLLEFEFEFCSSNIYLFRLGILF